MSKPIIWCEGIIGSGKTTVTRQLADRLNLRPYFEPVKTNPYLSKFYEDPKQYGFAMQMYLLGQRYAMQQSAAYESLLATFDGCILDRGLPGDRVFAKLLREKGYISQIDWETYEQHYAIMSRSLTPPSMILYLDVDPEIAMQRMEGRGRIAEASVTLEYLQELQFGYLELLSEINSGRHAWAQGMEIVRMPWNSSTPSLEALIDVLGAKSCTIYSKTNAISIQN